VFLSVSTYVVVSHTLIDQRVQLAEQQTYLNARLVRSGIRTARGDIAKLSESLGNPTGSRTLIYYDDRWFPGNIDVSQNDVPEALRNAVNGGGEAQRMIFQQNGETQLAIGIPIPAVGASYYEISTLNELDRTLRILSFTLVIASIFTTLGGAALGRWASRLVLRPVTEAASAAEEIAEGNMHARLQPEGDSDLDRLVLSFNRMVDALQGRIQRDARFASDVSHELRSPLMTLSSGLSVMQARRDEMPQRARTALDLLAEEVQRFQRMVQDLLEISRSDAGQTDVVFDEVLIGEFVERVCEAYERTDIPLEFEEGVDQVIVSVDKRRMERVVGNLIENADRYAGGPTRIGIAWSGKNVRVFVDDAGSGVPENERERIFERFARGESARARASGEGTGLGLSLVAEHVKLHNGRVWVEDSPEGGARFIVELPRVDA
jgi:signal transduction histidine kinase